MFAVVIKVCLVLYLIQGITYGEEECKTPEECKRIRDLMEQEGKDLKEIYKATMEPIACQGFEWRGRCFFAIIPADTKITFDLGVKYCQQQGGFPANIYSKEHYDKVVNYMKIRMPEKTFSGEDMNSIATWLGMNFNALTNVTTLRNDEREAYVEWIPTWPRIGKYRTNRNKIALRVNKDTTSTNKGMWNNPPNYERASMLCEKKMTDEEVPTTITQRQSTEAQTTLAETTKIVTTEKQTTQPEITTRDSRKCQGFEFDNKCFFIIIDPETQLTFKEAEDLCQQQKSYPANIYSVDHYEMAVNYISPLIPEKTPKGDIMKSMAAWLGMTFNPMTSVTSLYNDDSDAYVRWMRNWPRTGKRFVRRNKIAFRVNKDLDSKNKDMWNNPPNYERASVLCEKKIKDEEDTTTMKPETTEPQTTLPETTEPQTTLPETTEPQTTLPETTRPETQTTKTTELQTTLPETTTSDPGECRGFEFENKCFFVIIDPETLLTFKEAEDLCQQQKSYPANIYSADHYEMAVNYIRPLIPEKTPKGKTMKSMAAWLGMTFKALINITTLHNDDGEAYVRWKENWPRTGIRHIGRNKIAVRVNKDLNSDNKDMWNNYPNYERASVLCEKKMKDEEDTTPTMKPETTEPQTTLPETTEPQTTMPETTEPQTTLPETTEPQTTRPETQTTKTTELQTTLPETTTSDPGECQGFEFENKCFFVIIDPETQLTFKEAEDLCQQRKSYPANIYNADHYEMAVNYIRPLIPEKTPKGKTMKSMAAWLGMTFKALINVTTLHNDDGDAYVRWKENWPRTGIRHIGRNKIAVRVNKDLDSDNKDMWNNYPNYERASVLCEKKIKDEEVETTAITIPITTQQETTEKQTIKPETTTSDAGYCQGVSAVGKCFEFIDIGKDITYNEGRELCSARLGLPANIYNEKQYDDIVEYLRPLIPENENKVLRRKMGAWLGMTYNLETSTTSPGYIRWREGYPRITKRFRNSDRIVLRVHRDPTSPNQNMWNVPGDYKRIGVLCEF